MREDKPVAKGDLRDPGLDRLGESSNTPGARRPDDLRDPVSDRDRLIDREADRAASDGALGSHPVGTAAGATLGAVAAGAAVGSVAGPIGTAVGAAIGAVAGGFAGKGIADLVDPAAEDLYWRENWQERDYIDSGYTYDRDYGPAYRYGVESYTRYPERRYEDIETDLSAGWRDARGDSSLDWDRARPATRDAWQRVKDTVERAVPGDSDRDGK